MKILYIYFIFFVTLFSCTSKKKLIGTWYGVEKKSSTFSFTLDTLTLYAPNPQKTVWNANKSEIIFNIYPNSSSEYKKIALKYKINNDTLITDYNGIKVTYLKANNYIEFLNKKYKLKFTLPKNEKLKTYKGFYENYALKVFVGRQGEKIIARTEMSESLNKLSMYTTEFVNYFGTSEEMRLHYQVFADKDIPKKEMKKVYEKLRETAIKKIYRMYEKLNENSNFRFEYIR